MALYESIIQYIIMKDCVSGQNYFLTRSQNRPIIDRIMNNIHY